MPDTTLQRHPIRGAIWGLVMGLGVILLLMVFSVVRLDIPTAIYSTVAGGVFGVLWGMFAPPKKPKGPAPAGVSAPPPAPMAEEQPPPMTEHEPLPASEPDPAPMGHDEDEDHDHDHDHDHDEHPDQDEERGPG